MTSMSVTGMQSFSPLSRLQNELASEVSAGTISSSDQSALSTALTDIDSALKSERTAGGQPPPRADMQSKINGLISDEVSNGKLTSAQADELKSVFANAFKGGPGGAGGPPPGGAGVGNSEAAGGTNSSDSDLSTVLSDFLKLLQNSQGSSSGYGTSGNSLISQIQSLIVNYQA